MYVVGCGFPSLLMWNVLGSMHYSNVNSVGVHTKITITSIIMYCANFKSSEKHRVRDQSHLFIQ